jgi:cytochrome c biogenesis protein CcmG, thiol:disulfide interchange protein DsbE
VQNTGILIAVALACTLIAMALFSGGGKEPEMAPEFALMNLDGESVALSDFRGSVVVIDFWATWCSPCLKSFPDLHEVVERNDEQGVVLLVVSLDKTEKRARDYLVDNGYSTSNVLWQSLDAAREVKELFGVVGIPRTFIIDREGFIRHVGHPGRLTDADIRKWL